jgi:hypothetical protein
VRPVRNGFLGGVVKDVGQGDDFFVDLTVASSGVAFEPRGRCAPGVIAALQLGAGRSDFSGCFFVPPLEECGDSLFFFSECLGGAVAGAAFGTASGKVLFGELPDGEGFGCAEWVGAHAGFPQVEFGGEFPEFFAGDVESGGAEFFQLREPFFAV